MFLVVSRTVTVIVPTEGLFVQSGGVQDPDIVSLPILSLTQSWDGGLSLQPSPSTVHLRSEVGLTVVSVHPWKGGGT